MINKFLNFIKNFKDWLDLILKIVAVIGLLSGIFGMRGCVKQKIEKNETINILKSEVTQYETENGKLASESDTWKLKYKDLDKYTKEVESDNNILITQNSRFKQELTEAKQTIEDLNIKAKNVDNYIKNELVSKDSIKTELLFLDCDRIKIEPIKKKHISIDFKQDGDYLDVNYVYSASVETVVYMQKDKEQFFIWRWFNPRYIHNSVSVIDDPNATIQNVVSIQFDK